MLKNPKLINKHFSSNPHPKAVTYLLENPKLISPECFSKNENAKAVEYLLENPEDIDWELFSENPSIFEKDTRITEELIRVFC